MTDEQLLRIALFCFLAIFLPIGAYHRIRADTGEKLDRRQEGWGILIGLRLIALLTMVGLLLWMFAPKSVDWAALPIPLGIRWSGLAITVLGGALFVWTFRWLGGNLTDTVVTREKHELVTGGPYRWVRHPFYSACLLVVVGVGLMTASAWVFAGGVAVFVMLAVRTPREEQNLIERFGDDYRALMKRTGRFLPRFRS